MKKQVDPGTRNVTASPAPISVAVAIEIPAPQEAVFSYLSDLENNPQWNWAVTATKALDGRPARGGRYLQRYEWPRPGSDMLRIAVFQPPRLLEVTGKPADGRVRYRYQLIPITATSTRLETTVELEPNQPAPRPDMYRPRLRAAIAANLGDLRSVIIEKQARTTLRAPR